MVAAASISAHPTLPPEQVSHALEVLQNPHLSLHEAALALGLTFEQLTLFLASPQADEAHTAAATRTRFCVVGTLHRSVTALTKVLDECNAAPAPPPDAPPEAHTHRARQLAAACRASSILLRLANFRSQPSGSQPSGGNGPRFKNAAHGLHARCAPSTPRSVPHHARATTPHSQPATSAAHETTNAPTPTPLTTFRPEQSPAHNNRTDATAPPADHPSRPIQVATTICTSTTNHQSPTPRFLPRNASPAARLIATSGAPP